MIAFVLSMVVADPMVAPVISATVMPPEATVGDEVVLRLSVKHAEADVFEFPAEPGFGEFELVDRAAAQRQDGPMITEELVFKIASYEVGTHDVPKLSFRVGGAEFATDAVPVTIRSVLDAESEKSAADIAPKREPDGEPFAIYEKIYSPFYILAGVLALIAFVMAWKRRTPRMQEVAAPGQPQIAAHEAALVLFRLLRDKNLLQQGLVREYHFEATEILRAYLSQRYAVNALDLTTAELMLKLSGISAPSLDREGLRRWLDHADLVKFAKFTPSLDKGAEMVDFFEQLVWATRPPAPKAVEAAA